MVDAVETEQLSMTYEIIHKHAFDVDFVKLSRNRQRLVVRAIEDMREHAESPRGNTIKRLDGHGSLWRYRQGDLRIIYDVRGSFARLLAVGNRRDIYDRFYTPPEWSDGIEYADVVEQLLNGQGSGLSVQVQRMHENLAESRRSEEKQDAPLPQALTPENLTRWHVPSEHHYALLLCQTESDLLRCEVPWESVERVLEHLYPRPAEQIAEQPDLRLVEPEDLIRYAEGDLLGFLLKLDSEQDRFVDWALSGPTLVKGGPGSGKSTVALYRAREFAERGAGTLLFTTYTNALVKFSRQLLEQLIGDIPTQINVNTVDSIVVQIVRDCDKVQLNIGGANEIRAGLNDAEIHFAHEPGARYEKRLLTESTEHIRKDYLVEEVEWVIEGRNLRTVEEYLETDRAGRGYGFNERNRRAIWKIYQHVQKFLGDRRIVTWGYVRARALDLVRSGAWPQRWDTVIVDEAQDLTPTALALCIELCQDPTGLFLTADASQSLYNRGFRWKDVHEELRIIGRTRILRRNYRSTRQISEAAASILRNTGAGDEEALDQVYVHSGPRPVIHACRDDDEQLLCLTVGIEEAARELRLPINAAAILVPNSTLAEQTAKALNEWGLPASYMTSREFDLRCPKIKVLTIRSAKGLEFPFVAIPFLNEGILPRPLESAEASDLDQHLSAERRLFFVGCSRAMRRLLITCTKNHQSPFLGGLTREAWRWE